MADKPFLSYSIKRNFTASEWRSVNELVRDAIIAYSAVVGDAEGGSALYSEQNTKAGLRPKKLDPSRRMPIARKDQVYQEVIRLSSAPDTIGYFWLPRKMASFDYESAGKPCRFLALSILKLVDNEFPGSVVWRSCKATAEDWGIASRIVDSAYGTGPIAAPDIVELDLNIERPDHMDFRA